MILAVSDAVAATTASVASLLTINVIVIRIITTVVRNQTKDVIDPKLVEIQHSLQQLTERIAHLEGQLNHKQ